MVSMKFYQSKNLLLALALALTSFLSASKTHAQSFNDIKTGITKAVKNPTVSNSLYIVSGEAEGNWIMVVIKKNSYEQTVTTPIENGRYKIQVALQDGPGLYDLRIYKNSTERYSTYRSFKTLKVQNTDSRDMSFLLPTERVQSDDPQIIELVQDLTRNAQNDEEAFKAIYDYITTTISYDWPAYNDGTYVTKSYTALDVLNDTIAVCSGYSNLLAAMARAYGIRAKIIHGVAQIDKNRIGDHAWNEVYINGEWKMVDSTWDAGRKYHNYYFMDKTKFAQDHYKEEEMKY